MKYAYSPLTLIAVITLANCDSAFFESTINVTHPGQHFDIHLENN